MASLQLEAIVIGPFELVDLQSLSIAEQNEAKILGNRLLRRLIFQTRLTRLCDNRSVSQARDVEWKRLVREKRTRNRKKFLEEFDPQLDDAMQDSRLQSLALRISRNGNLWGLLHVYNVRATENGQIVRATAYPAPAIPFARPEQQRWISAMRRILGGFLSNDYTLADGRDFRLRAWRFPTDQKGHRWTGEGEPWAEALIDALVADGFVRTDRLGTVARIARP